MHNKVGRAKFNIPVTIRQHRNLYEQFSVLNEYKVYEKEIQRNKIQVNTSKTDNVTSIQEMQMKQF